MTDEQTNLLRDVLAELRSLRADLPLIRHELQRVAREHEGLRIRVDALEEARDPFPTGAPPQ
jgi:hypothetical protein